MIFDNNKLLLIAGPCALENDNVVQSTAKCLKDIQSSFPELTIVFKGSFDKANRTSIYSKRGPGIIEGLKMLEYVKNHYEFFITTDIHLPEQANIVANVCDVIQIPAFLCRQTDILVAAAKTGKVVSVKKGQFLSPHDMRHIVCKLQESNASEIWQIERGTTFGYNNLVVDMRSFPIMAQNSHPVIFDATHSVQLPGASEHGTGGERQFVSTLAKAAIASGASGLFFEIHPSPQNAICDASNQIATSDFKNIISDCLSIWHATHC